MLAAMVVAGCNDDSGKSELQRKIAELEEEMDRNETYAEEMSQKLDQVDILIDSIGKMEGEIAFNLEKGTRYEDHVDRLRGLGAFVEYTKQKIVILEKDLSDSDERNKALRKLVVRLRGELYEKEAIIEKLNEQLALYKAENEALVKLVDMQNQEIIDLESQIKLKINTLGKVEDELEQLRAESQQLRANAFYERAIATEELANRTKLAGQKKKDALLEAYELYKMAYEAGRDDASVKIEELKAKL